MSRKYDFHGVPVEEALDTIEELVSEVRMSGQPETVEFVTGHGVIKYEARELLKQVYDIETFSPLTSPSIIVTIE